MQEQQKRLARNLGEKLAYVSHPHHYNETLERIYRAQIAQLQNVYPAARAETEQGYNAERRRIGN